MNKLRQCSIIGVGIRKVRSYSEFQKIARSRYCTKLDCAKLEHRKISCVSQHLNDWIISRATDDIKLIVGQKDKTPLLKDFLNLGIKISDDSYATQSLIVAAASNGCAENVSMLLSYGANIRGTKEKAGHHTALYNAAASGSLDTVKVLIDAGADPNEDPEATPLHHCIWAIWRATDPAIIQELKLIRTYLLEKTNYIPIILNDVIRYGDSEFAFEFIKAKKVFLEPELLESACYRLDMTKWLLEVGLNPNYGNFLPLHKHVGRIKYFDILKKYVQYGANIDAINNCGQTALMIACGANWRDVMTPNEAIGNVKAVILLLNAGANPNIVSKEGLTAFEYAQKMHNPYYFDRLKTNRTYNYTKEEAEKTMDSYKQIIDVFNARK